MIGALGVTADSVIRLFLSSFDLDRPRTKPLHTKMRLAELATVPNFERLKSPYVGVTAYSVFEISLLWFGLFCFKQGLNPLLN